MGFTGRIIRWLREYLNKRECIVRVNNSYSQALQDNSLPQGTV